jgi:hypothetical protein
VQSLRSSQPCFASSQAGKTSAPRILRVSGGITARLLTAICVVSLGGCATTTPVTKTSGAVEELMKDPNYAEVRQSAPAVKEWARRALHYVNDLSLELGRERNK